MIDKYEIVVFWSDDDDAFVAEVPELAGCLSHGATQEEALANAKVAAQLWIDTAREFVDPIPEARKSRENAMMRICPGSAGNGQSASCRK